MKKFWEMLKILGNIVTAALFAWIAFFEVSCALGTIDVGDFTVVPISLGALGYLTLSFAAWREVFKTDCATFSEFMIGNIVTLMAALTLVGLRDPEHFCKPALWVSAVVWVIATLVMIFSVFIDTLVQSVFKRVLLWWAKGELEDTELRFKNLNALRDMWDSEGKNVRDLDTQAVNLERELGRRRQRVSDLEHALGIPRSFLVT